MYASWYTWKETATDRCTICEFFALSMAMNAIIFASRHAKNHSIPASFTSYVFKIKALRSAVWVLFHYFLVENKMKKSSRTHPASNLPGVSEFSAGTEEARARRSFHVETWPACGTERMRLIHADEIWQRYNTTAVAW